MAEITGKRERYNLRGRRFIPPKARTSTFQNSFVPQTVRDWNNLDIETQTSVSVEAFTSKLNANKAKTKIWYYTGERYLSILHARLRMLCSCLNDHLFSFIHVVDSPACDCGHVRENNRHYLLDCPLYTSERDIMVQDLTQLNFEPTIMNLLNGNAQYTDECNIKAFHVIQNFIKSSKSFLKPSLHRLLFSHT